MVCWGFLANCQLLFASCLVFKEQSTRTHFHLKAISCNLPFVRLLVNQKTRNSTRGMPWHTEIFVRAQATVFPSATDTGSVSVCPKCFRLVMLSTQPAHRDEAGMTTSGVSSKFFVSVFVIGSEVRTISRSVSARASRIHPENLSLTMPRQGVLPRQRQLLPQQLSGKNAWKRIP